LQNTHQTLFLISVAAPDEIADLEEESKSNKCPSRGKSYFISFVYQDPTTVNTKKKKAAKKEKEEGEEEEDQKPPAKKLKNDAAVADQLPENMGLEGKN